jgi:hypothetical protein
MKPNPPPAADTSATLQTVLDRLAGSDGLSDVRKRDLRSAVTSFAKLRDRAPAAVPLDLADIRTTLDCMVPAGAKLSSKRWSNLRSDLAAAVAASGLRPMLKTRSLRPDEGWSRLLAPADRRVHLALSRFARWASLRGIAPESVDDGTIERFIDELDSASLIRNLRTLRRTVALAWNVLVDLHQDAGLRRVSAPPDRYAPNRAFWQRVPTSFRQDLDRYLSWAAVPDPLADGARARALAPLSLRLRRTHIHSAVTAAAAAGVSVAQITSLASLVEPETFRTILRHCWREDGAKLTAWHERIRNRRGSSTRH